MDYRSALVSVGLSEKAALIYLSLVESGPATISTIAKNTGLHRPAIYKTLPELHRHAIVTAIAKGKLTHYAAEHPEKLSRIIETTQALFSDSVIPELSGVFQSLSKKPTVKVLNGKAGLSFVFDDIITSLKKGDKLYRYSSVKESLYENNKYLPKDYRAKRDRKQLERLVITNEKVASHMKPKLDRDLKTIPTKYAFEDNIAQHIYANKVAFIDYNTETALIIENTLLAEFQRKIFSLLYAKL